MLYVYIVHSAIHLLVQFCSSCLQYVDGSSSGVS